MEVLRDNKLRVFLTVFLVYLFYIAPGYITAGTVRYMMLTKSIVDDKTFTIDKNYDETRDWAFYKGHYYIGAAPGLSLLAVPIYIAVKPLLKFIPATFDRYEVYEVLNLFFAFFLAVLPGAIIAVLLYDLLGEFNLKEKERLLIVFASSFGTILFFYSTKFMAHVAGAFLVFSAFYILFKFKNAKADRFLFFLAGFCLGLAVLVDYILIFGSGLIFLYALVNFERKKLTHYLLFFVGIILLALVYMYYHYICFDNPFSRATTYSRMIGPIPFRVPNPKIMFELTFGTYRGLFMYMPILLISIYGIFAFFMEMEKKYLPEVTLICVYSLFAFFAVSMFCSKVWPLGGDFGPRYLISIIPFLIIPITFAYRKLSYNVVWRFATLSIFINWCGVQYGDADSAFTNIGLFIFRGLNSDLAEWTYKVTNTYVRKLNVITHFSPLIPLAMLLIFIYAIWKKSHSGNARIQ